MLDSGRWKQKKHQYAWRRLKGSRHLMYEDGKPLEKALSLMGGILKTHRVLCCVIAKRRALSVDDQWLTMNDA